MSSLFFHFLLIIFILFTLFHFILFISSNLREAGVQNSSVNFSLRIVYFDHMQASVWEPSLNSCARFTLIGAHSSSHAFQPPLTRLRAHLDVLPCADGNHCGAQGQGGRQGLPWYPWLPNAPRTNRHCGRQRVRCDAVLRTTLP